MLDLFSGIGGFSLAASWVWGDELEIVSFCEIDKFCQKVLNKHWPNVQIHDDIKTLKGDQFGTIDIICGGFPCQPFSVAGKQGGARDDRALWPEMFRVIKESKPIWVIGENVAGIINMELDNYISDLEGEGYEVQAFNIPACGVDARHKRERVWILAYSEQFGCRGRNNENGDEWKIQTAGSCSSCECKVLADSKGIYAQRLKDRSGEEQFRRSCRWSIEPAMGELVNGISGGLVRFEGRTATGIKNRVNKLKALGNAIVPQVAAEIMFAIKKVMDIEKIS